MKRILVTGGAGYIGSHTCKQLSAFGYEPITYDNLSTGHKEFVKWGPLVIGDLHETSKLYQVIKDFRPLAVIHFAASAYVGESVSNPFKYYRNNVGGTLSLIDAMRRAELNRIVFSSTCATYGVPDVCPINESCPQIPINPYGQTKLMIEQILRDLTVQKEIRHISLRYFNAAGADPDGEIGERHDPETHLIPLAIQSALGGIPLSIFGSDFPTEDGSAVRDYIHVNDLAKAHIKALEHLLNGGTSDFINLGTGKGSSVSEIVRTLQSLGLEPTATYGPRRDGDPAILVADSKKAKMILGWTPDYTHVKGILQTAIHWHIKQNANPK